MFLVISSAQLLSGTLLCLAELALTLNCFSLIRGQRFQTNQRRVAMGTKMGLSCANRFVGFVEHQFFSQYNGPKPELNATLTTAPALPPLPERS